MFALHVVVELLTIIRGSMKIFMKKKASISSLNFLNHFIFLSKVNYARNLLFIYFIYFQGLHAEIEQIRVSWNAFKCQTTCVQQIQQSLNAIKGVKSLKIDGPSGIANIEWDPTTPLNYEPFRYAAAAVGINIDMRVSVKGIISHENENIFIISDKDQTRFLLIGPILVESGRYIPKYNLATHPLPTDIKEQLLDIERKRVSVVISGPLFLPAQYPLTLVTEHIKMRGK